jgi:hypothetical protein
MSDVIDLFPPVIPPHTFGGSYEISPELSASLKPFIESATKMTTTPQPDLMNAEKYIRTIVLAASTLRKEDDAETFTQAAILLQKQRDEAIRKAEQEKQWQPIETAPKDGTMILIFEPFDKEEVWPATNNKIYDEFETGIKLVQWLEEDNVFGRWEMLREGFWGSTPNREPTHWMPLPGPPALTNYDSGSE